MDRGTVVERLREVLEFYLSPGNLCHDKVLARYLTQQKRVPLSTFLEFNKVRDISGELLSIEVLQEAASGIANARVEGSSVALVPGITTKEVDEWKADAKRNTVYIENVPDECSHDTIRTALEGYGKIAYISLPRFTESKIVKGFAFVQFADSEGAHGVLAADNTTPTGWPRPIKVLPRDTWASFKPQFVSLQARITTFLQPKSTLSPYAGCAAGVGCPMW